MIRTFLNEEKSYIGSHCNRALSKQLAAPVLKKKNLYHVYGEEDLYLTTK